MAAQSLGILGVGTMGEALIKGIQASPLAKQYKIIGSTRTEASAQEVTKKSRNEKRQVDFSAWRLM